MESNTDNAKLYVGNIDWNADESDLVTHFGQQGTVKEAKIITDRDTGRSKGFGFITMETADEARTAIADLDGSDFNGRPLRVSEAQERTPRTDRF